jgi:integrase
VAPGRSVRVDEGTLRDEGAAVPAGPEEGPPGARRGNGPPPRLLQRDPPGCIRAGVSPWHPHQLRHNAATAIRREFGLDVARAVLGLSTSAVTAVYAEADMEKAAEAMERLG